MPIRLYSDRLKDAAKAGQPDVYQYDSFPAKLRVQIRRIVRQAFGPDYIYDDGEEVQNDAGHAVREILCQEMGKDTLTGQSYSMPDLLVFIEHGPNEGFLDSVDLVGRILHNYVRDHQQDYTYRWGTDLKAGAAIEEINFRFRDAGVGFQIENGSLIRLDSQFMHAETVKPALSLLNQSGFEGPQAEFLAAHEHYRAGRHKEAITEAAKAFESLMKAVCDLKGWTYNAGARASDLLKVLRAHKLWPDYLDASFDQLLATLASGLPQVRNQTSAHGQGAAPKSAPSYVAAYALHLAAAKMVLIAEAAGLKS